MFNTKDTLFGKKDEIAPKDYKASGLPQRGFAAPGRADAATPAQTVEPLLPPVTPASLPGSKLIVGPDIKLKGVEITDCDTLVVEGRVEASMDSRVIQIAENGVYSGTVGIDVAEIYGRFEGELTARKQLVIHATGRVSGTIRYGKLTIEDGGEISGTISTLSGAAPYQSGKGSRADIAAPHDPYAQTPKPLLKTAPPAH